MKNRAENIAIFERLVTELRRKYSSDIVSMDYEIQDGFQCVLIRAMVAGSHFVVDAARASETMRLMNELDEQEISWVLVFLDSKGKVLDALNGERQ